jgi:uncharacterized protein (UPF0261 family)
LDPVVAVLGTLDTKGAEVEFLARALRDGGLTTSVIDLGLRGRPTIAADVSRAMVLAAAPESRDGVPPAEGAEDGGDERERAMAAMAAGAGAILRGLEREGKLLGAIGIGGSKGTWMATSAMRELPWGVPKVMVASTVAGDLRRYAGHRDIVFMPTVVDLAGLNSMTRVMLGRGAATIRGMIGVPSVDGSSSTPVAMTMAGVVTPLGQRIQTSLARRGIEVVVYPANGAGGMALEEATAAGRFSGIVDIALLELANELLGGICSAGPDRLTAAGHAGLPQVIVTGAVEFANFAGPDTVPPRLRSRPMVEHTPAITLVRLTPRESAEVGARLASKVNQARGPVEVLLPLRGFSAYDVSGGPFADPVADTAFQEALERKLNPSVPLHEIDRHVNDPEFAKLVVDAVDRVIGLTVAA